MSLASKITFGACCVSSVLIITYVHIKQVIDKQRLHQGVIRDIETQQRRKIENTLLLQKQDDLKRHLEKLTKNDKVLSLTTYLTLQVFFGILFGLLFGLGLVKFWKTVKGDPLAEFCITTGSSFLLFSAGFKYSWISGASAIAAFSIMIKSRIILKTNTLVMWNTLVHLFNMILMFWVGLNTAYVFKGKNAIWEFVSIVVLYISSYIVRGIAFSLNKPIIALMGHRFSWVEVIVATLGGIKQGSVSLPLALACRAIVDNDLHFFDAMILVDLSAIFVLSYLINGTLFRPLIRFLAVEQVTMAKKGNMSRAIDFVLERRERTMDVLKLDRTTADANWIIVSKCTLIKHPYMQVVEVEEDKLTRNPITSSRLALQKDSEIGGIAFKFKGAVSEQHEHGLKKLFAEATLEANLRILKVKRVLCTKQVENGYISSDVFQALTSVLDTAADHRGRLCTNVVDLQKYWKPKKSHLFLRQKILTYLKLETIDYYKPHNKFRGLIFSIVISRYYELFNSFLLVLNIIPDVTQQYSMLLKHQLERFWVIILNTLISLTYITDVTMKMIAYGTTGFFKSNIHLLDLISCIASIIQVVVEYYVFWYFQGYFVTQPIELMIYITIHLSCFLIKFLRCLVYMYLVFKHTTGVAVARFLQILIDRQLLLGYEIGCAYLYVQDEVDKKLNQIVDDPQLKSMIREREQKERFTIIQDLGILQRDHPTLAITTKTKIAGLTILKEMKNSIDVLAEDGLLDPNEYDLLMQEIEECYHQLGKIGLVNPSPPEVKLKNISWLVGEEAIYDYLLTKAVLTSYNYDDVFIRKGEEPEGIYLLLSGLVKVDYTPSVIGTEQWQLLGKIPNCDFFTHLDLGESQEDIIVSGNVFGELGIFLKEKYEYSAKCITGCQVFYFPKDVIQEALKLVPKTGYTLENKIWKAISIRLAMLIVSQVPQFHSWKKEQLKLHLQRGFVPSIGFLDSIPITNIIDDIFLIQGVAFDAKSGVKYTAPTYIPFQIKVLLLSDPFKDKLEQELKPPIKLLIVPSEGMTESTVMEFLVERTGTSVKSHTTENEFGTTSFDEGLINTLRRRLRAQSISDDVDTGSYESIPVPPEKPKPTEKVKERKVSDEAASDHEIEEDDEIVVYMKPQSTKPKKKPGGR